MTERTGTYLCADELAELIECLPNSTYCMKRWLDRNKWPYELNRKGFPKVSRAYYNARMFGQINQSEIFKNTAGEPDFDALMS